MKSKERAGTGKDHALVIGGSMGGLLAARVLTDHYRRVTVVERDSFPDTPDHRAGVPQSRHAHGFLARGQEIAEELFPGLTDELLARGAKPVGRVLMVSPQGPLVPPTFDGPGAFSSRTLLEWSIRQRLGALPNITLMSDADVLGLAASENKQTVTGITLQKRGGSNLDDVKADLVVDASGRHSKVVGWLTALGYDAPEREEISSELGYASRFYRKPKDASRDWDALIVNGRAPYAPGAGAVMPIENDQWHVSLGGFAGHYPPPDEAGFLDWAKEIPDSRLYEALKEAEPLSPIRAYRTPKNHLSHFERLDRRPANLIFMGDSVCAFNPIYGQGMTVAALEALDLRDELEAQRRRPTNDFERRFQARVARTVAAPWSIAVGEDLRWEGVKLTGGDYRPNPLIQRYTDLLLTQGQSDPVASRAFHHVIHLLAPPRSMVAPRLVMRVLSRSLKDWIGARRRSSRARMLERSVNGTDY